MLIEWVNPATMRQERIGNAYNPDSPEGQAAINMARQCLGTRFGISSQTVPNFNVTPVRSFRSTSRR
jgi:hypothetical protein